jgi:hypothetical protein
MSESVRARVIAGSMSAISAAVVAAVLLGVSIAATHAFGAFGPGTSTTTVSAARGAGTGVAQAPAAAIAPPAGPAVRAHPLAASGAHRGHRASTNAEHTGPSRRPHTGRGNHGGAVGESVHAGPVQASATAGSGGATVALKAGPAGKKVKVRVPPPADQAVGAVQKTSCTLLTC